MSTYHQPVMLKECIEGLQIKPDGIYVDATFGGGGHSKAILEQLADGHIYAFDQDEEAHINAKELKNRNLTLIDSNFRHLKQYLKMHRVTKVDGILADLGVSSHQIDDPLRGFSTRFDGLLDMRMDRSAKVSARNILNEYSQTDLHKILGMYGEVKNAKTLANSIVNERADKPIETVADFKKILDRYAKRGKQSKYYAQVFQAIRIEVNDEMKALEQLLLQSVAILAENGRLVVMSYHSLEDRIVKNFINKGKIHGEADKDFYGNVLKPLVAVNKKPIVATEEELSLNNRARSAKLRIAERTSHV